MNLGELWETAEDREIWHAAVHGGGHNCVRHNSSSNANEHESWSGQSPNSNRSFFVFLNLVLVVACGIFCGQPTDSLVVACRLSSCSLAVTCAI